MYFSPVNCLLCQDIADPLYVSVFRCFRCGLVFKDPALHLSAEEERKRYSNHINHPEDKGYVEFLNRMLLPLKEFLPSTFTALDFGCGPGPTLSQLLNACGGVAENYDPLFFPDSLKLTRQYDLVTCTEVVEHFHSPAESWALLASLVKPGGLMAVMTQFIGPNTDYSNWWYKNDPTHVVFYEQKTFHFLGEMFQMDLLFIDLRSVVIMRKKIC